MTYTTWEGAEKAAEELSNKLVIKGWGWSSCGDVLRLPNQNLKVQRPQQGRWHRAGCFRGQWYHSISRAKWVLAMFQFHLHLSRREHTTPRWIPKGWEPLSRFKRDLLLPAGQRRVNPGPLIELCLRRLHLLAITTLVTIILLHMDICLLLCPASSSLSRATSHRCHLSIISWSRLVIRCASRIAKSFQPEEIRQGSMDGTAAQFHDQEPKHGRTIDALVFPSSQLHHDVYNRLMPAPITTCTIIVLHS